MNWSYDTLDPDPTRKNPPQDETLAPFPSMPVFEDGWFEGMTVEEVLSELSGLLQKTDAVDPWDVW